MTIDKHANTTFTLAKTPQRERKREREREREREGQSLVKSRGSLFKIGQKAEIKKL